jgi:hypothetical protein
VRAGGPANITGFEAAPAGRLLLYTDRTRAPLTLIENWSPRSLKQ